MCNLYSITTNQEAIRALFRVVNRYVGNLAPMPGVLASPQVWPAYCAIRGRFMKIGSIEFSGRTIACLIRNQSGTGAALEVVIGHSAPPSLRCRIA